MSKKLLFCLFLLSCTLSAASAQDSLRYLAPSDTVFMEISNFGEKLISHEVQRGQTLYAIARYYGMRPTELKFYNAGTSDNLQPGQRLKLPLPNRSILRFKDPDFHREDYAPIFYRIKRGDTYYGLSKRVLKLSIDTIKMRLIPREETLRPGQLLFIGWISVDGIPDNYRVEQIHPMFRENYELRKEIQRYLSEGRKVVEGQGVAVWQSENRDQKNYYALHEAAPVNSIIEIFNPMKKRTVYAKVVGRIPVTIYPPNVEVVLSNRAARLLGAIDPKFFVKIKYYK